MGLGSKFFQLCFRFENIHNKMLGQVKGKKEKVLADCYFVLKKREPDARRLTSEIQTY